MNLSVYFYTIYLVISIGLTVWVARTLYSHGRIFLIESFGSEQMGDSVNHLLKVGFYLVNLGLVSLFLKYGARPDNLVEAIELLSTKLGVVLVVLGGMHFFNLKNIAKIRSKSQHRQAMHEPAT